MDDSDQAFGSLQKMCWPYSGTRTAFSLSAVRALHLAMPTFHLVATQYGRYGRWNRAVSRRSGKTGTYPERRIDMPHWKYLRRSNSLIVPYMFAR